MSSTPSLPCTPPCTTACNTPVSPSVYAQRSGYLQYPDGRRVPAMLSVAIDPVEEIQRLSQLVEKISANNVALRRALQASELKMHTSGLKEAEHQRQLQSIREEMQKMQIKEAESQKQLQSAREDIAKMQAKLKQEREYNHMMKHKIDFLGGLLIHRSPINWK